MAQHDPDWRPKAVVFDLLTALLDSWSLWDASTPSRTPEEGRRWRMRYLELTFGAGAYGGAAGPSAYESLVARAARDVGLPGSAPAALLRDWAQLRAWPEAGAVLAGLRGEGYRLGVVTNCSAVLGRAAVRAAEGCVHVGGGLGLGLGLGSGFGFDAAVTAEESGFYKPAGAAYEAVLPGLGVAADEVLFVAGSAGDVQGATDAGMRVVWHNRAGLPEKGDAVAMREGRTLDEALRGFL